jgi:starch synthase (maltosyl-transferring)
MAMKSWARHEMRAEPNDVFSTSVHFSRLGRHEMQVEAWLDVWGGFARDLAAKFAAGHDLALELREALALIDAAIGRTPDGCQAA